MSTGGEEGRRAGVVGVLNGQRWVDWVGGRFEEDGKREFNLFGVALFGRY